jgi:deoxyribonuclease-4
MSYISDNNLRIGGHIGFSKKITPTIEEAVENGMGSVQFFCGNPKAFKRQRLMKDDISRARDIVKEYDMNVISHYPYTSSLCGSVKSLAWSGDAEQDAKTEKILEELEYEVNILAKITNKSGVVIHPGSFKNREDGLQTIAKSINRINFEPNARLLLENCAGEGTKLCKDFEELSKVLKAVKPESQYNVGVCVDTAHIHGVGKYNLSKRDDIDRMFHDFDRHIGMDKFNLLHLNDSQVVLGSKKDRHEQLTHGKIWEDNEESLKYLLKKCGENNIPMILETSDVLADMELVNGF